MNSSLRTSASGMLAQQRMIDVIANNLANVNTTGFKRSRVSFEDVLYETVREGRVADAARIFGRPYELRCPTARGDQRGRTIGFPTANLDVVPGQQLPAEGVYAGWAVLSPDEERLAAAISVGRNPHSPRAHARRRGRDEGEVENRFQVAPGRAAQGRAQHQADESAENEPERGGGRARPRRRSAGGEIAAE